MRREQRKRERIETSEVAVFLYLEPLVTLGAAVALLGEPVAVSTLLGGVLVMMGVFMVQWASQERGSWQEPRSRPL